MTSFEDQRANDPCACGSGKRYKLCHKPLHRTKPERFPRKFYLERWSKNASAHAANGDYEWMLDQLPAGAKRVLDIGIGDGAGVVAMFKRWSPDRIVAVEENPECIGLARRRLAALTDVDVVGRLSAKPTGEGRDYDLAASSGKLSTSARVAIIATDPLVDEDLVQDIVDLGPFDVVTAWLLGSHEARAHCRQIQDLNVESAMHYRLRVQNVTYELADKLLNPGGRLQFVDRIQHADLAVSETELRASHVAQAAPTSLKVDAIAFRSLQALDGARVTLINANVQGGSVTIDEATPMHLASVISVKP